MMATGSVPTEEELYCPLCQAIFKNPVVLSCRHNFCKTCLTEFWRENPTQECLVCKRRSSMHQPPLNFALQNQYEAFLQKRAGVESADHGCVGWHESNLIKYACKLTLDPNTAHKWLSLTEENKKVTWVKEEQSYLDCPERFTFYKQVLCGEGLTGCCYWEVDWEGVVSVGVAYSGIGRKGRDVDCRLGWTDKSWVLECSNKGYTARHNDIETEIGLPSCSCLSHRVGVYVDWPAGSVSFYIVSSETQTHIHTYYCRFTQELHAAIGMWQSGSSLTLI